MNLKSSILQTLTIFLSVQSLSPCNTSTDHFCGLCLNHKCFSCYDSFLEDNQCKKPKTNISFCEYYLDQDHCLNCKMGYSLSDDLKSCSPSEVNGCLKSSFGDCYNCDGHLLDSSSFECISSSECSIEGCRSCSIFFLTESCDLCQDDYILKIESHSLQITCQKREPLHDGCGALYNDNCYFCDYGYIDVQTAEQGIQCQKSDFSTPHYIDKAFVHFNCANGNDRFCTKCKDHSCQECHGTYPGFNGNCINVKTIIFGCEIYSDANTCQECESGRFLSDNACPPISLPNCLKAENQYRCQICHGFQLKPDGSCDFENKCPIENCLSCSPGSKPVCSFCEYGYTLDLTLNACVLFSQHKNLGCEIMEDKICLKCAPNFYISSNALNPLECKLSSYYKRFNDSSIQLKIGCGFGNDPLCSVCLDNRRLICNYSFINLQGICEEPYPKIEKCLHYTADSVCIACEDHFYFDKEKNECLEISIKNCLQSVDNINCIRCEGKLDLDTQQCLEKVKCSKSNCRSCIQHNSEIEKCDECEDGYIMSFLHRIDFDISFECIKVYTEMEHCQFLNNGVCLECKKNYYYSGSDDKGVICQKRNGILIKNVNVLIIVALVLFY